MTWSTIAALAASSPIVIAGQARRWLASPAFSRRSEAKRDADSVSPLSSSGRSGEAVAARRLEADEEGDGGQEPEPAEVSVRREPPDYRATRPIRRLPVLLDLLIVALAAATAASPLLRPGFPQSHDGEFHLFRLLDYVALLRDGELYPRWSPFMAVGYGYPVHNFYAPASAWVGSGFQLLGLGAVQAFKATLAMSILVAGLSMYLLARREQGRVGGVVSGVAYATLPYLLVDVYVRGALAEAWGLAILPLAFAAGRSAVEVRTLSTAAVAALAFGALALTHNMTALLGLPFVAVYAVLPLFCERRTWTLGSLLREGWPLAGALAWGLGLSAIYWAPALGEMALVASDALVGGYFDYRRGFHAVEDLVERDVYFEYNTVGYRAGLVQIVLAMAGLAIALSARRGLATVAFLAATLVLSLYMQVELSTPIWEAVPLLRFLQFPWRWLMLTGLATALLVGSLGRWLGAPLGATLAGGEPNDGSLPSEERNSLGSIGRLAMLVVLVAALVATAVARLSPVWWVAQDDAVTPAVLMQMERHRSMIGATTAGEYLPLGAGLHPIDSVHRSRSGDPPPRPVDVRLESASLTGLVVSTTSDESGPLVVDQLYFPGWEARVDGRPAPVRPFGALGLVSAEVPAGEHRVEIRRGLTPLQQVATGLGIVSLCLVLAALLRSGVRRRRRWVPAGAAAVALALGLAAIAPYGRAAGGDSASALFANGMQLAGWRVIGSASGGLGTIDLHLYWSVRRPVAADYVVALRVLDGDGRVVGRRDQQPSHGLRPTRLWMPGMIVRDEQQIRLLEGAPAGRYRLALGVRSRDGWVEVGRGQSSFWREPSGQVVAGAILGELDLKASARRLAPDLRHPTGAVYGDAIELASWEVDPGSAAGGPRVADVEPGRALRVRLKWRAIADTADYAVFVHLLSHDFKLLAQDDERPHRGYAPTALWHPGDEIADEYVVRIPEDAPPGRYFLSVGLYRRVDLKNVSVTSGGPGGDRYTLGEVKVKPRPLALDSLPGWRAIGASFGGRARLSGLVLDRPSSEGAARRLRATLYWEALVESQPDATVFVHMLGEDGRIVSQHDAPPAGGHFPTSAWDKGDAIRDEHEIVLEGPIPEDARLAIGLYDPATGRRLALDGGGDHVTVDLESLR